MLEPAPRNGPWPFKGSMQFAWNSTSLGLLKECPRKYQYVMLEGWSGRGESPHLLFGSVYHAALELYDNKKAEGADHDQALDMAVDYALHQTWIDGKSWESAHTKKTREALLRSVIWYLDQFKDDPCATLILANGKPAVELSFNFTPQWTEGDGYILCGHLDRVVTFNDDLFVMDRKTTGSTLGQYYFSEFSPHNQMSLYTLAAKVVFNAPVSGVIIDAAQIAVGFTAFGRSITMRSEAQLEEFLDDTRRWIYLAEHFAQAQHWPMNESSCNKFGGCPFKQVCSKDPSVRENFLHAEFDKAKPLNPLEFRE